MVRYELKSRFLLFAPHSVIVYGNIKGQGSLESDAYAEDICLCLSGNLAVKITRGTLYEERKDLSDIGT
jgi:hypothetical protein